ncbi:uncharacterized protein LOC144828642 [Lissotriton helveticus]
MHVVLEQSTRQHVSIGLVDRGSKVLNQHNLPSRAGSRPGCNTDATGGYEYEDLPPIIAPPAETFSGQTSPTGLDREEEQPGPCGLSGQTAKISPLDGWEFYLNAHLNVSTYCLVASTEISQLLPCEMDPKKNKLSPWNRRGTKVKERDAHVGTQWEPERRCHAGAPVGACEAQKTPCACTSDVRARTWFFSLH